ncbi:hypothetical protein KPH14_001121 [Odynerus spinipes]|nr:hypothetical protein KPH14_001121 [Odynerus spinipes]
MFGSETTSKLTTPEIIEEERTLTLSFTTKLILTDTTIMTFSSEKTTEISFEIETTETTTGIFIPSDMYSTSSISLSETYKTSYVTEMTTTLTEYEISSTSLTSTSESLEDFETSSTGITSPISLSNTFEEYTLTTGKRFIYTTEHLEWWATQSSLKPHDYTLTTFVPLDEKTMLDLTLPETTGISLLSSTDTWGLSDFEKTMTTAKYIDTEIEEGTRLIVSGGESSSPFTMEAETTEFPLYVTTLSDIVSSLMADILNKTEGQKDQEKTLENLMNEIKRIQDREKKIAEMEEEQKKKEEELKKRKKEKETEEKERKKSTSVTDTAYTYTTSSFSDYFTSYDKTTMSESIELLSINDTVTTFTFIALESTSAISMEPITSDISIKNQKLKQEIERLKNELERKEDRLEEWERRLQERRKKFEEETKEFEGYEETEFEETTEKEFTLLSDTTEESVFTSFSSSETDYTRITHKFHSSSTTVSARTRTPSSSTFKPPVESELFTPAPPTEKTTSIAQYLNRVKITCKTCEGSKSKGSVGRD